MPKKRNSSNKPEPRAKGEGERLTPSEKKQRKRYLATQIKLMERDMTPVDFKFSFATLDTVREYNERITHLSLQRKLDGRDYGSLQHGVANALRALIPSGGGVQQTVELNLSRGVITIDELADALEVLPLEGQEKVFARLRRKRVKAEAVGSTPELTEVH